ncbi:MAG: hypothetical protein K1X35_11305 [Caulobacteraceae bacterium]|nr:hypothetical protein [Caulobacteraceae bacterium]
MKSLIGARAALAGLMIAGVALGAPALAQNQPGGTNGRAEALKKLSQCRSIADDQARLACYDNAAQGIDEAENRGELVVVDRGQVREAKRSLFGFDTSALNFFDRGSGEARVEVNNVTLTIDRAYRGEGGRWVMVMTDGQVWRQIDSSGPYNPPRHGSTAEIRKASLGSYFLNVDGQTAIRARREK